jgi:hypothetical protein
LCGCGHYVVKVLEEIAAPSLESALKTQARRSIKMLRMPLTATKSQNLKKGLALTLNQCDNLKCDETACTFIYISPV